MKFGGKSQLPEHTKDRLMSGSMLVRDPILDAKTIPDLLQAYLFKSDEKLKAGLLFAGMTVGSFAMAYMGIQIGKEIGGLIGTLGDLRNPLIENRMEAYVDQRNMVLQMIASQVGLMYTRHLFASNFNRKATGWVTGKLSTAVNNAALHMTQNISPRPDGDKKRTPNSPEEVARTSDQIVTDSVKSFFSGSTGLYMGTLTAASGLIVSGYELYKMSRPVQGWESLGDYGILAYAAALGIVAVGSGTYMAVRLGKFLKNGTTDVLQKEGEYRFYAQNKVSQAFQIAANGGQYLQNTIGKKIYDLYDKSWFKFNFIQAGYMAFKGVYEPMKAHWLVHLPILGGLYNGSLELGQAMAISGVIAASWNKFELLIDEMPAISNTSSNGNRILALLAYMREVRTPQEFYKKTGISEFVYETQAREKGIKISKLELMHEGMNAKPFLTLAQDKRGNPIDIDLAPGDWAMLTGPSGCGKTHIMKAVMGARPHPDGSENRLNPYGRGRIVTGEGAKLFYFPQDTMFEPVTLKELIAYPTHGEESFSDREVTTMMKNVGLQKYIPHIHQDLYEGKPWQKVLSGGERKKLMTARAILKEADYYFLDEPTTGLDTESTRVFYEMMKKYCGHSIVVCVTHEKPPPMKGGEPYFNVQLEVQNGVLTKSLSPTFDKLLRLVGGTSGSAAQVFVHNGYQGPPVQ